MAAKSSYADTACVQFPVSSLQLRVIIPAHPSHGPSLFARLVDADTTYYGRSTINCNERRCHELVRMRYVFPHPTPTLSRLVLSSSYTWLANTGPSAHTKCNPRHTKHRNARHNAHPPLPRPSPGRPTRRVSCSESVCICVCVFPLPLSTSTSTARIEQFSGSCNSAL